MEGISEQIQQLGLYQRSRLICCLMLTLLLLLCVILSLVIILICIDEEKIDNSSPARSSHEYVYVIRLNESWVPSRTYKYGVNATIPSV